MNSILNQKNLKIGWSVFWRVWLWVLLFKLLLFLGSFVSILILRPSQETLQWLREVTPAVRSAFGLVVLLFSIFCFHLAGKKALAKRGFVIPNGFLGWAIFWRAVGLSTVLAFGAIVFVLFPVELLIDHEIVKVILRFLVAIVVLVLSIHVYGWATLRVRARSTK